VCFLVFYRPTGKHLALLTDVVSGLKSFSEAPPGGVTVLLGLRNPPRRGHGELAKPGLVYPLVWIPSVIQLVRNQGREAEQAT
jgi:hypothetical protein